MRHQNGYRKLGRITSHRMAMLRNLTTSFLEHGKIQTTVPKAKELKSLVEKMITKGKKGDLTSRRVVEGFVYGNEAAKKCFTDYATRFKDRPGGYTRIVKLGARFGDGAEMCVLELVDFKENLNK